MINNVRVMANIIIIIIYYYIVQTSKEYKCTNTKTKEFHAIIYK